MRSIQELNLAIDELTNELELTRNEKTKLEKKVADLTEDRDNVEAERDSFKHQLSVMKTDRDNWKKIAEAKEKDLDHLKVHYNCCVSDLDTSNSKVINLTAEVGKLKKELESLEALNKLNADASKQYAEELNTLREQYQTLEQDKKISDENHKETISQYVNRNQNLSTKIEELKRELENMTSLNDLNFNEVNLQVEKVRNLTEERRSLSETVSQLEKRLAQTKETVTILTEAVDATNQDNKTLHDENDKLRTVNQESGKLLLLGYEALANAIFKIK